MILERGDRADDVDRRFLAGTGGKALIVNSLAGEMLEEPFIRGALCSRFGLT
jgi:hypothetical protein